ncbi:MAG: hypothetical protein U5N85_01580 [Arcicella sp.]|nr:hypothetical protein [Arcicella sp.]
MEKKKRDSFGLSQLAKNFHIEVVNKCTTLDEWLSAVYELNPTETELLNTIFEKVQADGNYWNEEELKIQLIGFLFFIANIDTKNKIKVFYERPLAAEVESYNLSVVVDCLVATPLPFHTPENPYFFLQEYKRGRGDDKDPEAQMLTAMLIAQELNKDDKPIFGSYLFGSRWKFCTLVGKDYCQSPEFDADKYPDLLQIVFVLRKLKELILNR